jgi:di/tricarboxylate transporter
MGHYGQILDESNAARIVGWDLLRRFGCHSGVVIALLLSLVVWNLPPIEPMDIRGMHFLASMVVAVALWVLDVFEDYIVGLTLLFAWVVLDIIPGKVALAGFSENSWFFVVGAFGIAAAIGKTSLPERLANKLLCWIPSHCQKTYRLFLLGVGALTSPLLPSGKARAAVAMPISHAISGAAGFTPRSNGSAAIALSARWNSRRCSLCFSPAPTSVC